MTVRVTPSGVALVIPANDRALPGGGYFAVTAAGGSTVETSGAGKSRVIAASAVSKQATATAGSGGRARTSSGVASVRGTGAAVLARSAPTASSETPIKTTSFTGRTVTPATSSETPTRDASGVGRSRARRNASGETPVKNGAGAARTRLTRTSSGEATTKSASASGRAGRAATAIETSSTRSTIVLVRTSSAGTTVEVSSTRGTDIASRAGAGATSTFTSFLSGFFSAVARLRGGRAASSTSSIKDAAAAASVSAHGADDATSVKFADVQARGRGHAAVETASVKSADAQGRATGRSSDLTSPRRDGSAVARARATGASTATAGGAGGGTTHTYDVLNRRIILAPGTTDLNLDDLYADWQVFAAANPSAPVAFTTVGGDATPSNGQSIGLTYFLENNWKIRPYEGTHTLTLTGNLYTRDGSMPVVETLGAYHVLTILTVSSLVTSVAGGGLTANEVRDAVWNAQVPTTPVAGSWAEFFSRKMLTVSKFLGLK